MQVQIHVSAGDAPKPYGEECVNLTADGLTFKTPQALVEAGFPVQGANFTFDSTGKNDNPQQLFAKFGSPAATAFGQRQNLMVFGYGQRATVKRQNLFGTSANATSGFAYLMLKDILEKKGTAAAGGGVYTVSCYVLGSTENVVDLIDPNNEAATIVDTVKEGPRVRNVEIKFVSSPTDLAPIFASVAAGYEKHFSQVLQDDAGKDLSELTLPPYNPAHIIMEFCRFTDADSANEGQPEVNSIHFVALGDSERPVLCGIDTAQLTQYERTHRTLSSVASVLGAIRCNRLRVPYGKSKLTAMMKRGYNGEKGNPHNEGNKPTFSILFLHVFTDDGHAEETYHTLAVGRKILSVLGGGGIGPMTRDLAVEKWRLEQDILELRDELTIAKAVHDYRPCIYDQPKPVQNIQEEEQKRITAIQKRREEAREKAQKEIAAKAKEEAERLIQQEEAKAAHTVDELQKMVDEKRQENERLQVERTKKVQEYERHLEKIQKKKNEEEAAVAQLKQEIKLLEEDLASQQEAVEKTKKQLEIATMDQAKGREAVLKEREAIKKRRAELYEERRKQREKWLKEIRETNALVLQQVAELTKEREAKQATDGTVDEEAEETEQSVREDIESIDKYLPKLISLDEVPADQEATDSIRRQLEEYFTQEKESYATKLETEKQRKAQLEKAVEQYRSRIVEHQSRQKKEHLAEAMKKENHLASLLDQVLQYLQQGVRMCKVSSTKNIRRRFFFLSEDCKRLYACELDEMGMPVNRRKPTTTVILKDVKKIILGQYTPSFVEFAGNPGTHRKMRDEAMGPNGSFNPEPTAQLTPENFGRYQYRSFALDFRNGKTLELVCETDSDCEAWVVALKRLLGCKTPFEMKKDRSGEIPGCVIEWGAPLDIRSRAVNNLNADEATLCAEYHIAPQLYMRTKKEILEKSQHCLVTVYDVRVSSMLDLYRSQILYEFFTEKRLLGGIPSHS
jgi:hypothetical protein